jgi:hypothetical protein
MNKMGKKGKIEWSEEAYTYTGYKKDGLVITFKTVF